MKNLILSLCIILSGLCRLHAQALTSHEIDSLAEFAIKSYDVPGMAVAVIKDGRVVHAKGYGVRSLKTGEPVDEHTLFGIASNTKAFTAAALGILIDEGRLTWDSRVTDLLPEFKLYNPYVTEEFTVRDLLTHRSGLSLGAGDLMLWPDSTDFTREEIIHNLRFLKASSSFRTKYDYDNNLYIVAGEIIARVSGISYEEFIERRIMQPLGMTESAASYRRVKDRSLLIDPHASVDGKLQTVGVSLSDQANPCGGIWSNLTDMCKWVMMQLNDGKYGDSLSQRLVSRDTHDEMWMPQTIIPVRWVYIPYKTHFSAYALGWIVSDVKGLKQVMHTGGLAGIATQVLMIPELKLGIIVLTNQQVSYAFNAVSNTIKDSYLGIPKDDWVTFYKKKFVAAEANAKAVSEKVWKEIDAAGKDHASDPDTTRFTGVYRDAWFGDVTVSAKAGRLWFASKRSPKLSGELTFYRGTTFIARWNDRSLDADAFVTFALGTDDKASGMKLKAVSPATDFSFDFQDLDLKRIK